MGTSPVCFQNHMGPFMSVLREHIGVMRKEELASHQPQLTTFFLEALDFRTQHAEVGVFPPACPEVTT